MEINSDKNLFPQNNLLYWKNQIQPNKNIIKYTDELFPPNNNSVFGLNEKGNYYDILNGKSNSKKLQKLSIKWLRPEEIYKNKQFFLFKDKTKINISDIKQGSIADCYFISSIMSLTKNFNIIYNLFKIKEINKKGFYEIILFIEGQYKIIIIDDYLPVFNDTNELCFCKSLKNEIWPCLLEKAWAKINGGYSNIIKGFAHNVLETLTGFPSLNLMHSSYSNNQIMDYIMKSYKNKYLITSTTKDDFKETGIERNHTYALICYYIINNITIIKLRDPNGDKILWKNNNYYYMALNKNKLEKEYEIGLLYLSFEEYIKYFSFTNISFIMTNYHTKQYKIDGKDIYKGNIFNIYLKEDCILSINVIRKIWIFNRGKDMPILPSFICLVKYNPDNIKDCNINIDFNKLLFSDYYSNINSEDNICLNKELKKGYYLFYSYIDYNYNQSISDNNSFYYIKFDSNINFEISKKPCDIKENGFPVLKNIKIQEYLYKNNIINNQNNINYLLKYKNKDLAMKIVYNMNNKWLKIIEDCSEIKNIFILNNYHIENNIFEWYIPPKKFNILLGMVIDTSKDASLNLKSKNFLIKSVPFDYKNYEINISLYANTIFN